MINRRKFILGTAFTSLFAYFGITYAKARKSLNPLVGAKKAFPIVISTWNHGLAANEAAWEIINGGGKAVEAGVRIPEGDPKINSVGFLWLPRP